LHFERATRLPAQDDSNRRHGVSISVAVH
jgi:hypothetical protein